MIRIFIGFDSKLPALFYVFSHSIHRRASLPVSITPLIQSQLKDVYWRQPNGLESTEFSFSRFLTPHLSNYEGWSIFADNDIIARDDIAKLWALRDEQYSIMVIKHQYQPREENKFLNTVQTKYEKKNWSSVILFNNAKCRALTPEYVNSASGLELHQFKWLENEEQIGAIPSEWNHLVGYDEYATDAKMVHFTSGGPYFNEYRDCDYSDEWFSEREDMLKVKQIG